MTITEVLDSVIATGTGFSTFQGSGMATEALDSFKAFITLGAVPDYPASAPIVNRRADTDYVTGWYNLLPQGSAWPRLNDTTLYKFLLGQSGIWGDVDSRAADFIELEADPRATVEMLADWERCWALPDPGVSEPMTVEARQWALANKYRFLGSQDPQFFVNQAAAIGYQIKIIEHSPFMAGISQAGDTRALSGPDAGFRWECSGDLGPNIRFYWSVLVLNPRLSWFRAGSGQAGVDPHLRVALYTDLETRINCLKPAHTQVYFDYSGLTAMGAMAGTP
jgi:uncharacterized protein YmfQ (DUF2313 family)